MDTFLTLTPFIGIASVTILVISIIGLCFARKIYMKEMLHAKRKPKHTK